MSTLRNKRFEIRVVQQPLRARMCGFGEKDRRPIDPPPICELLCFNEQGERMSISCEEQIFFVCHCGLWSEDCEKERNLIANPCASSTFTRILVGSLVSSTYSLVNPEGIQSVYFIFPDLSVRMEGKYRLKFSLCNLGAVADDNSLVLNQGEAPINSEQFSDIFTVYTAKRFPGMTESTELSKCFSKQGVKIPIRHEIRSRKTVNQENQEKNKDISNSNSNISSIQMQESQSTK